MPLQHLTGFKVLDVMKTGSSRPVIVEDKKGDKYLVKLRESLSNPFASISDFLACKMGANIGLPIVKPQIILLDASIDIKKVDEEVRSAIRKSYGWNIAYPFFDNAKDVKNTKNEIHKTNFTDLWIFDVFLLNIDRTIHNSNIIEADGRLISFDYETSMLILGSLQDKDFYNNDAVLKQIRQNPLYQQNFDKEQFIELATKLKHLNLSELIGFLPNDWVSTTKNLAQILEQGISKAIHNKEIYFEMADKLPFIAIETEEERKKKVLENRKKFETRFNGPLSKNTQNGHNTTI